MVKHFGRQTSAIVKEIDARQRVVLVHQIVDRPKEKSNAPFRDMLLLVVLKLMHRSPQPWTHLRPRLLQPS